MHEPDTTNPDQGGPAWQVTVDARDLHDILQVIPADVRETEQWKNLDRAAGTAGEPQQPVNVPAVRCLVTKHGGTMLDLWLPVGIATDVPIPLYGPLTMTLMPIDGTGVGGHGTPQGTHEGHTGAERPPAPTWRERISSFQVSEAEFLRQHGIGGGTNTGVGGVQDRGTAVEVDVTHDQLNLHVMLEGGPPWTLDPIEAELLAVDLQRAARMLDAR